MRYPRTVPGIPIIPSGPTNPSQYIQIKRFSGTVSELRLRPPTLPINGLLITAALDGLELEYRFKDLIGGVIAFSEEHKIGIDRLEVSCLAFANAAVPNASGCLEIPFTCVTTSVSIQGLSGTVPTTLGSIVLPPGQNDLSFQPLFRVFLETLANQALAAGLKLHFTGFSASALTFDSATNMRLSGTPSTSCSHDLPPPPPPAPTRGLVRASSSVGMGEYVGDRGSVIPFELTPEMRIDWVTNFGLLPFRPFTPVIGSFLKGATLPNPGRPHLVPGLPNALPLALDVSLDVERTVGNACWTTPMRPPPGP